MYEAGVSVDSLAKAIGIHRSALYRKFHNPEAFTIKEVRKILEALNLSREEASEIFFNQDVA